MLQRMDVGIAGERRVITGIAWDHRRCWGPLEASVVPYRAERGQEVRWDRRSLYSFGEGDLGSYAAKYDLVIYDHPFVGDIAANGLAARPQPVPDR